MQKIKPCLWFDQQAEEAAGFYVSLFDNSKIGSVSRYSESSANASGQPKGSAMVVEFELDGQQFMGLNGGPHFKFTPATSFFVHCEDEKEIDVLWKKLGDKGSVLMPLDNYPFADKYGWLQDRFGLSWQLMLAKNEQKFVTSFLFVKDVAGKAEEAMKFYTSQFPGSSVQMAVKYEPGENGNEGSIKYGRFALAGKEFVVMDNHCDDHDFTFTPAISMVLLCESQEEIDHYWEELSAGGRKDQCGWLQDKFGVSWQIVPSDLARLLGGTEKQTEQVMKSVISMKKLDIAQMRQAYENA